MSLGRSAPEGVEGTRGFAGDFLGGEAAGGPSTEKYCLLQTARLCDGQRYLPFAADAGDSSQQQQPHHKLHQSTIHSMRAPSAAATATGRSVLNHCPMQDYVTAGGYGHHSNDAATLSYNYHICI